MASPLKWIVSQIQSNSVRFGLRPIIKPSRIKKSDKMKLFPVRVLINNSDQPHTKLITCLCKQLFTSGTARFWLRAITALTTRCVSRYCFFSGSIRLRRNRAEKPDDWKSIDRAVLPILISVTITQANKSMFFKGFLWRTAFRENDL